MKKTKSFKIEVNVDDVKARKSFARPTRTIKSKKVYDRKKLKKI